MFIVYSDNDEVLVTTVEQEPEMLSTWFENTGRDVDEFERELIRHNAVRVRTGMRID